IRLYEPPRNDRSDCDLQVQATLVMPDGSRAEADLNCCGLLLSSDTDDTVMAEPNEGIHPEFVPEAWKQDPVLGARRRFRLQPSDDPWADGSPERDSHSLQVRDFTAAIADAYGLNLVADAYPSRPELSLMPASGEEQPLYVALNYYLLRGSRWTREGEF